MSRIKNVNRLFLILILISVGSPFLLGKIFMNIDFYQSVAVSQMVFLAPVLIYLAVTKGEILGDLQLKVPKLSVLIMVVLFSNLMEPLMSCLNLVSQLFVENQVAAGLMEVDGFAVGRNMMYIALVPALAEEFIFRGIFYHSYRSAGIWKAALISGLCFGLVHMNINQFLYAFVLGVIFALLVEATGSVISAIIAHFMINASSVSMLALQEELEAMLGNNEALGVTGAVEAMETLSRQDILLALQVYAISALICSVIAYFVFKTIARWSGREAHIWQILHPGKTPRTSAFRAENERRAREVKRETLNQEEYSETAERMKTDFEPWEEVENQEDLNEGEIRKRSQERLLTPSLVLGIVGAVTYMIVMEFFI